MTGRAPRSRRSRIRPIALRRLRPRMLVLASLVLSGCYTYVPLRSTVSPAPGDEVEIELSDAGRVGMASDLGPEMARVDGTLVSAADSEIVVKVGQLAGEHGGVTRWEGEQVTFKAGYIRTLSQRRFSTTRTAILAATVAAGVLAFIASRNLLGIGIAPGSSGGGVTGQQ